MALDYDFFIDALGFNLAITKDTPYERATAQFKKDQLDSTPTVGDQSLTGWWTRGQLSFHRGAGVKYYELISDDDTIENRYRTSIGVNPWVPGEVTLGPEFDRIPMANILDVAPVSPPVTAGGTGPNLVTNGTFEAGLTDWSVLFGPTIAQSSTHVHGGSQAMRITWPTTTPRGSTVIYPVYGLTVGQSYTFTAWVYVPSGAPAVSLKCATYRGAASTTTGAFEQLNVVFLASATSLYIEVVNDAAATSGQQCWVDDVEVRLTPPGAACAALLNDGTIQYANDEAGQVFGSYTDEGVVSVASDGTTLFACTPSAIERQGAVTRYQYVTNPTFDAAGDVSFATAQGGITRTFTGSSIDFTTVDATDGVRFELDTGSVLPVRTNLITNPSVESTGSGWAAATGNTLSRSAAVQGAGAYALYARPSGGPVNVGGIGPQFAVTAGLSYAAQIRMWLTGTGGGVTPESVALGIQWSTGGGATLATATADGTPVTLSGTVTAPVGATWGQVVFGTSASSTQGVFADAACVEQSSTVEPYFDGDSTDLDGYECSWEGVPHASRSIATPTESPEATVLCRVKTSVPVDVQAWDGATYTPVATTTAGVRHSFYVDTDAGLVKFQLMGAAGHFGATSVTELSATSSLAESNDPTAGDSRWSWSGATDDSIQTRAVGAAELSVLWVPPSGSTWAGCWYAKSRLLAVDNSGRWYALSPTGGGVVEANDAFWNSGHPSGWSVTEAPASIYLARGNEVYALGLDTDGLLPTIAAATIAAQLPVSESIASVLAYLGYLLICTNRGVRAAVIQDNGALVYGPRFIEGDFSRCSRIAANGDLAYVTGVSDDDGDSAVYAVNLTEPVSDLEPAFTRWVDVEETPYGGTLGADGALYLFDDDGLLREGEGIAQTGTLTTGYHRLGTLDPKAFRFLRVKTEGTVGTVSVTAITPDGTEYAAGSLDAGDATELDLGSISGFPAAVEYLALRFTLEGDGTDGPTLLGYQLKALPVPRRQRMIRVPLHLKDRESNRSGAVIPGNPWERLAALEALEQSNALVEFNDKKTGETGSAYVESVEVTVTGGRDFGGVIFLTLRLV